MNDREQFETIAIIRAYAKRILKQKATDIRPSTAKIIFAFVCEMHNAKDRLEIKS